MKMLAGAKKAIAAVTKAVKVVAILVVVFFAFVGADTLVLGSRYQKMVDRYLHRIRPGEVITIQTTFSDYEVVDGEAKVHRCVIVRKGDGQETRMSVYAFGRGIRDHLFRGMSFARTKTGGYRMISSEKIMTDGTILASLQ